MGENTVLQLNILETGVLTLVVQNSSPTRLRLVGDELWTTRVRTPVSKMFRWRTYNSQKAWCHCVITFYLLLQQIHRKLKLKIKTHFISLIRICSAIMKKAILILVLCKNVRISDAQFHCNVFWLCRAYRKLITL